MTKTETTFPLFARMLTMGDTFLANGVWETVAQSFPADNGVWVYTNSGESYFYLGYVTLRVKA